MNKRLKLSLGVSITALLLSACGANSQVQTVEYYQQNPDQRWEMEKTCKNNPGELEKTPNCVNSKRAHVLALNELEPINNKYWAECKVVSRAPNCDQLKADVDAFVKKNRLKEK